MRFTCEHCGKRYVTNDVLQPGRVYRTKCKACGGLITVKGSAETAGPATGEVPMPAGAPRPSSPSFASLTPAAPTPPAIPASAAPGPVAVPPPRLARTPTPPPVPAPEPRYIDLFDGESLDGPAPTPAPIAARRKGGAAPAPVEPTPAPVPVAPPRREADPFLTAVKIPPPPSPAPAPSARAPEPAVRAAPSRPARKPPLAAIGAAAGVALVLLVVGAVWRPWMPTSPRPLPAAEPAAAPARPAPAPETAATPPATAPATSAPAPAEPAAVPATPPAAAAAQPEARPARPEEDQAAKLERQRLASEQAEKARTEKERLAREEKDRLEAEKAERARLAREEKERVKAEKAEKERLAREEKDRLKAQKAEQERLAREEKDRLKAQKAEPDRQEKVARAEPPPPPPGLTPDAIQSVLSAGRKAFEACFRDQTRGLTPPIEAAQVAVRFLVQPGGTVTSPEIADAGVAASPAGQCLKTAAAGLRFPAFKGEPARVEAPVAVPPPPPGGRMIAIEFTGPHAARGGGDVGDTIYSERPNDASISDRTFADGVITYAGQVGLGEGSKYAGIGMNVNIHPGPRPVDASRFKSMTIRLAATGTRSLRIRIIGADDPTRLNGCYPVTLQRVTPELKEYVIKFSDFDPEGWCGSKGKSASNALKDLTGFEVADANMDRQPVTFSTGTIILNP